MSRLLHHLLTALWLLSCLTLGVLFLGPALYRVWSLYIHWLFGG